MSELWWPENYCTRYAERCTAPYDGPPHYPSVPLLRVVDLAAKRLRPARATFWRNARANALAQWEDAGFQIAVQEGRTNAYAAGFTTIDVTDTHDGTRGQADFGALPEYPTVPEPEVPAAGVAWAHVDPDWFTNYFKARDKGSLVKVLGHEFGHTLGFGHNPDPEGIMSTYAVGRVSAEEKAIAKAYWKL